MSHFYGSLKGNRGEATRAGSKSSGIKSSVQSYEGSIITHFLELDGEIHYSIEVAKGSSSFGQKVIKSGKISELVEF